MDHEVCSGEFAEQETHVLVENGTEDQNPNQSSSESDNENITFTKPRKKLINLSDSDSETFTPTLEDPTSPKSGISTTEDLDNNSETDLNINTKKTLSRIKNNDSDSDDKNSKETFSDHNGDCEPQVSKSQRIKERRDNMTNKFKNKFSNQNNADEEEAGLLRSKLSEICDSDSSDSDYQNRNDNSDMETAKNCNESQSLKANEDTKTRAPQRMSAKQAMEQMHKIKSESSRMLREKECYLPYHKPKQISLKDIMVKKNIQFIPGAKKLTLRMNEEQLREYAMQMEKREKEIIELYESDEENENVDENPTDDVLKLSIANRIVEGNVNDTPDIELKLTETEETKMDISMEDDDKKTTLAEENIPENDPHTSEDAKPSEPITEDEPRKDHMEESISTNANNETVEDESHKNDTISNDCNGKSNDSDMIVSDSDCVITNTISDVSDVKNDIPEPNFKSQILEQISSSLRIKPTLSGSSGDFIDFSSNEPNQMVKEVSGVAALKKKFLYHATLKTPIELEQEKEKKLAPGTAHMNFKRELEDQISEQKLQEWKKKQEEMNIKNLEEKLDNELSDCEEILEKENKDCDVKEVSPENENDSNAEDEDSEEIEDDIVIRKEKVKEKCDFVDDEAELDDDEPPQDDENDEGDSEKDSDSSEDEEDNKLDAPQEKRQLTRIIKPISDSDSSNEDTENPSKINSKADENNLKESNNPELAESVDLFNTPEMKNNDSFTIDSEDILPPGQRCPSGLSQILKSNTNDQKSRESGLAGLISPLAKFSNNLHTFLDNGSRQISNLDSSQSLSDQRMDVSSSLEVQKQLFVDTENSDVVQDTQDIAALCSGKFPSQSTSALEPESQKSDLFDKIAVPINSQMTQGTENELMELCTGNFAEPLNKTSENDNIVANNKSSDSLNDSTSITKIATDVNNSSISNPVVKSAPKDIKAFFSAMYTKKEYKTTAVASVNTESRPGEVVPRVRYAILSSSDEKENDEEPPNRKVKKLKSRHDRNEKRKVKPLEISDSDSDDDDFSDDDYSDLSLQENEVNVEKLVNYDSEENEIEVKADDVAAKNAKKKQTSEFFEREAELTSEDEWKGSGDEDEKGLNEFEWEAGDADQIDQEKVSKELEKIHRYQMLDQDKREIKLLQDILIEDDMEGGTRERKFRWKNIDASIESGAVVGDDNQDDGVEEVQSEEQWRRQRYERETFLREMKEKQEAAKNSKSPETSTPVTSRLSLIKASLKYPIKAPQNETDIKTTETNVADKKTTKEPTSPVKTSFMQAHNTYKKSFISKGQATLDRLALLTKNIAPMNGDNPSTNLSSLAPGKKKNFVFATVSPPCENKMSEDAKLTKRKLASEASTPPVMKKLKLAENPAIPKARKSLLDHIQ